ncbi:MAG: hypothetical protein CVV46_03655 [Spirochaetae bacterium HGW-Spirochaetae-2]|nr:MAG: hypothetical protein CVV46_03655 [Spirochaetae bacterium HGW-Spirochaetae-2]
MNKKLFVILILITIGMMGMAHGAKEIIYLEDNSKTTDPLELMKVISVSEQIISDIEDKYAKEWNTQKEAIEKSYQPASNKIEQSSPELWETDRQFEKRKESEISNLTNQMNSEVSEVYSVLEGKKQEELVHYQEWLANGQEKLFQSRTVDEGIQITPLEYLRNERLWPMHISVDHPIMNFKDFQIFIKFKDDGKKITQSVIPNIQYVDGYYFAISDNYWTSDNASSTGWYEIVEFDVRNGRIENVVFDAIDDDWESRKALSKDGDDDMVRFGGSSDEWHVQTERAEKYLEKTQNPLSIRYIDDAGHVDDIAGVSISVEPFFALIVEALAAGPISPVAPVFVPPAPTPSRVSGERYLEVFFSDSTQIFLESTSYSGIGIQQEIVDFDKAVKEKKLSAQIGWNITQVLFPPFKDRSSANGRPSRSAIEDRYSI